MIYDSQTREPGHQKCDKPVGTEGYYQVVYFSFIIGCLKVRQASKAVPITRWHVGMLFVKLIHHEHEIF